MIESLVAIGAALLVLLLPGIACGMAVGLRGLPLLALAGPLGVAVTAGIAVLLPLLQVGFAWWHPLAAAALVLAGSAALRRELPDRVLTRRDLALLAAIAASGTAAAVVAFGAMSLGAINSTYDGVFHLNAVAHILSTGNGSSAELYRMTHPGDDPIEFYPAAWHDLVAGTVQLSGVPIPLATNATWVAVTAAVWVPGVMLLAATAFGAGGRRRTALLAAPFATVFAAAPYLLLDWGTLFPTGLAYALLPAGLALLASALRVGGAGALAPTRGALLAALALWAVAAGLSHPRSLFGFVVLGTPLVLGWAAGQVKRRWPVPRARRRLLLGGGAAVAAAGALAAAGWAYVYRTFDVANRPIAEHLNGGPATAGQDLVASAVQALLNSPIVSPAEQAVAPAWLLSAAVLAALVLAVRRPEWRWAAAAWLLAAVLYCLAAGSNSDVAKLATGLWYKDKYRLISLLPVIAAPLLAGAFALAAAWAVRRGVRRATVAVLSAVAAGALLATAWWGPTLAQTRAAIAAVHAVPAVKAGALLDRAEVQLLKALPELTPPDAVIIGNPWNGSALSWAIGGREALFPHLTGDWDADRLTVAAGLDRIGDDPAVCAALDRLGAKFLLTSDGLLWGGDPQAGAFAGIDWTEPERVGELVAREGGSALYRITECG